MKTRYHYLLPGLFFLTAPLLVAQETPLPETQASQVTAENKAHRALLAERAAEDDKKENKKDPGYAVYKEGYNAILDERWKDAIKQFAEMSTRFPKSEYADDAQYWNSYALSHIDRTKAIAAYKHFLEVHPRSRYVDDAVADLGNLDASSVVSIAAGTTSHARGSSYSISAGTPAPIALDLRRSTATLHQMKRELRSLRVTTPRPPVGWARIPGFASMNSDESLDPATRVKMDAIYAIGSGREDETSFQTLRDIATDRGEKAELRTAAIAVLSDFKKFDVVTVFVDLARKDTSEEIQGMAIQGIGSASRDKNKALDALVTLFNGMSDKQQENRDFVLVSIAEIGNDKAVDFLANVAKTHPDYDLRSNAVYYLGSIGGEKARSALFQILKSK
jgi:HEAT repeat protein